MLDIVKYNTPQAEERLLAVSKRAGDTAAEVRGRVDEIISDIKARGFDAVSEWSLKLDKTPPRLIERAEAEAAYAACSKELITALENSARNIRDYQEKLVSKGHMWQSPDGGNVGFIVRPLGCVGMYVPGGTAAYPSTVLMTAIPAKTAGVGRLIMVTPPTEHLKNEVQAAALISGVDEIWALGGVQAVAALAFGCGEIPRADKIVGPGNAYVTEAKRSLFGLVDIDSTAGPSDIFVIADSTANPDFVAADLLSQAEHDVLAGAVVASDSRELLEAVNDRLAAQLKKLSRADIAKTSLADYGISFLCSDMNEAVCAANRIAPEHLELMVKDPHALLDGIKNAGAIFLGAYSTEPLGDYMAGPSHVLPTSGAARFFSPLGADMFLKKQSVIEYSREVLSARKDEIIAFAECEGLTAHAEAVRGRF